MRFLHPEHETHRELSLEDVFLVPQLFDGLSRMDVDLTPHDFVGSSHPLVSANMNAVTGKRMAETMARYGGLGVLPQDMTLQTVDRIVRHIKGAHSRFDTPLTVQPNATLRDVQGIIRKRSHDLVVVVDGNHVPVGVLTQHDLRDRDQYTPAHQLMRVKEQIVVLSSKVSNQEAYDQLQGERVRSAPVVDASGRLIGVIGRDDAVRMEILRPSVDTNGHLMVAAAIGISSDAVERAEKCVELGVSAVVLDTAHGHQRRMFDAVSEVRKRVGNQVPIVAGNVCTEEGTRALIDAGADIIKVNVGPGAMCTTRMQTGVGRPSFSSVWRCATEAKKHGKHVWADGGVRYPRDAALYLAAGASRVMIGSMLAGTYESPGDIKEDRDGALYKENYGMASARAVAERTSEDNAFVRAKKGFFREGISTSKIYLRAGFESTGALVVDFVSGIRSAMTYAGATDLNDFSERALVGTQTPGGFAEGTPHGRVFRRD